MFVALKGVDDNLGSGVGLAAANRLVELNGGKISIEANQPRGTRFFFSWPVSAASVTEQD
jgi:signal transduction histidine kinase